MAVVLKTTRALTRARGFESHTLRVRRSGTGVRSLDRRGGSRRLMGVRGMPERHPPVHTPTRGSLRPPAPPLPLPPSPAPPPPHAPSPPARAPHLHSPPPDPL